MGQFRNMNSNIIPENCYLTFHHMGYVVPSIEDSVRKFAPISNDSFLIDRNNFVDNFQKVNVSFIQLKGNLRLELIEPNHKDSPVHRFLEKNPGGGYHHIAFEAPHFQKSQLYLKDQGFRKITSVTSGFEKREVCFFLPSSGDSNPLIELVSENKTA